MNSYDAENKENIQCNMDLGNCGICQEVRLYSNMVMLSCEYHEITACIKCLYWCRACGEFMCALCKVYFLEIFETEPTCPTCGSDFCHGRDLF